MPKNHLRKYHKRPLVFEAIQWDGTSECIDAIINMGGEDAVSSGEVLEISFASDRITLSFLDYLIKEDNGDIAIMPLELFKKTYEEINEE